MYTVTQASKTVIAITLAESVASWRDIVEHEAEQGMYAPGQCFTVRQPCGDALPGHYGVYWCVWTGSRVRRATDLEHYLFQSIR